MVHLFWEKTIIMKKSILVVDDSQVVLSMLDETLNNLNYDVTTAKNGIEGCRHIETKKFDMVITDLNMPGMDGIELTKRSRQLPNCKFVPIVMLSGEEDEAKISEAKSMGISTFLKKPVKESQLKTILQIVLGT